jgi:hypothetical protein
MTENKEACDISEKPDTSELQEAYQEVGNILREKFPELEIPGAEIIFSDKTVPAETFQEEPNDTE